MLEKNKIGLGTKLTLLTLVPILFLSAINIISVEQANDRVEIAAKNRQLMDDKDEYRSSLALQVRESMAALNVSAGVLSEDLQSMLLSQYASNLGSIKQSHIHVAEKISQFIDFLDQLQVQLLADGYLLPVNELATIVNEGSKNKAYSEDFILNNQRFIAVVNRAERLPRQFALFVKTNKATLEFILAGKESSAINNFVYEGKARLASVLESVRQLDSLLQESIQYFDVLQKQRIRETVDSVAQDLASKQNITTFLIVLTSIILALTAFWFASRKLVLPLNQLTQSMTDASAGKQNVMISGQDRQDEIGEMSKALGIFVDVYASNKQISAEAARLASIVKASTTNIMMADVDGNIIYINAAAEALMRSREETIKTVFPDFSVDTLVNSNIDQFHRNPEHQRHLLKPENLPHKARIQIADLVFDLTSVALLDQDNNFLGSAVEWDDQTEHVQAEEQIAALIHNAAKGELDQRLDVEAFQGFMKTLALGVNTMLDTVIEPIDKCCTVLQSLAEGELSETMQGDYQGLFKQLQESINTSKNNLKHMVGDISEASISVSGVAQEILQGNQELSLRTENQAANIEETAASLEQLTSTVKLNSQSAQEAESLSSDTMVLAEQGGKVLEATIQAMQEIDQSSRRISDIIGVIDEIAFQTNLLALNAAVEAARAGEQGRGFGVVATEVRNLAQRSASAAKEIKLLIKDSGNKVSQGNVLVNESGTKLKEIAHSVTNVSALVQEISLASREQAIGIEEINKSMAHMDSMTQQNAASAEEATTSADLLNEQSENLMKLIGFFKV
ncbi:MAG: methyl-accepting chemotaxis protein [Oleiphilus sp.]